MGGTQAHCSITVWSTALGIQLLACWRGTVAFALFVGLGVSVFGLSRSCSCSRGRLRFWLLFRALVLFVFFVTHISWFRLSRPWFSLNHCFMVRFILLKLFCMPRTMEELEPIEDALRQFVVEVTFTLKCIRQVVSMWIGPVFHKGDKCGDRLVVSWMVGRFCF